MFSDNSRAERRSLVEVLRHPFRALFGTHPHEPAASPSEAAVRDELAVLGEQCSGGFRSRPWGFGVGTAGGGAGDLGHAAMIRAIIRASGGRREPLPHVEGPSVNEAIWLDARGRRFDDPDWLQP